MVAVIPKGQRTRPFLWTLVIVVVIVAVIHKLATPESYANAEIVFGEGGYDMEEVKAPRLSGFALNLFSKLLSNSFLGPIVTSILLNDNKYYRIVHLAKQLPHGTQAVRYPIKRLSEDEYAFHVDCAEKQPEIMESRKDRKFVSILDLVEAYKSGETTPADVIRKSLAGIEATKEFKAFHMVEKTEILMAEAEASRKRYEAGEPLSLLDGIPVAVKDEIDWAGYVTEWGSKFENIAREPAKEDDLMIKRLRAAGAIMLGKTTMTEYGTSPLGFNSHVGGPFNAFSMDYLSGGSSAGSAIAVAHGIVPLAIGFDGGGSIRLPSGMNGIFGLSPTFGRVPSDGDSFHSSSVIHGGPMCATAQDCAIAMQILAPGEPGHTYNEWYGPTGPPPVHVHGFNDLSIKGLRFGFFEEWFTDGMHEEHVNACLGAKDVLQQNGGEIVPFMQQHMSQIANAHTSTIASHMSFVHLEDTEGIWGELEPQTKVTLAIGTGFTNHVLHAAAFVKGWALKEFENHFKNFDVIISPTVGGRPLRVTPDIFSYGFSDTTTTVKTMRFAFVHNLLGFPAMTVPIGIDSEGLPIAFQIMAPYWREDLLLKVANFLQVQYNDVRGKPKNWVNLLE